MRVGFVKAANLPNAGVPKTLNNFEARSGTEMALEAAKAYIAGGAGPKIILLMGSSGNGKSHLLSAVGWAMLEQGRSVRYDYAVDLLDRLKACFDTEVTATFNEVWESYKRVDTLLLDDLGVEQITAWSVERLATLIDARYREERGLLMATNLSKRHLHARLGDRTISRLWDVATGLCKVVPVTAVDYRRGGGSR